MEYFVAVTFSTDPIVQNQSVLLTCNRSRVQLQTERVQSPFHPYEGQSENTKLSREPNALAARLTVIIYAQSGSADL